MRGILLFIIILLTIVIAESCSCAKEVTGSYHISRFDSCVVEEDMFFVGHYELGERQFVFSIDSISRVGNVFTIKGTTIDSINQDVVPYPCLYLVSKDGLKYRIKKELCMGNVSGNIDCCFEWNIQKSKPLIAIKAIGYCGSIYKIETESEDPSLSEVD